MSILIIAEAGVNHNGDVKLAQKLIENAAKAGADIVKFQTFQPEQLVSKHAQKAVYQKETTDKNESQLDMIRKLTLPLDAYDDLIECCKQNGIEFLSTPFDFQSIDFLHDKQMPYWKIPSGEITNLPHLIKIAKTGKPVLLSSGMSNLDKVKEAASLLREHGSGEIIVLHCTTEYPTPMGDVNLSVIKTLRDELGLKTGYSDHTRGIEVPIAAVAVGAVVIEKHFTLDRNMEGPDHMASLEPDELAAMVKAIRNIEKAMGDGVKAPAQSEFKNIDVVRKSIVAKRGIQKREQLSEDNITTKRPGNGISPMRWFEVLGTEAVRDFVEDELIVV